MKHALRAAIGGVALVIACAPAVADAAPKKQAGKLSVSKLGKPPSAAEAGTSFKVTARIANAKNRKAAAGRVSLSLRSSSGKATNLNGYNVKSVKAGMTRSLALSITVPATLKAGTYSLRVCVRRTGTSAATCKTAGRIKVTVKPAPAPAPVPLPAPVPTPVAVSADSLKDAITTTGLRKHLDAFQEIANHNGGNRASGLEGYGATKSYVVNTLRAAGYNPQVQTFDFLFFRKLEDPELVKTAPLPARTFVEDTDFLLMDYSGTADVTAPVQAVDINTTPPRASTSGCEASDFAAFTAGNIALLQRGTCNFLVKVQNAEEAGAAGAIVFNQGDNPGREALFGGTLAEPVGIPAVTVSYDDGVALTAAGTEVRLTTETMTEERSTSNVTAETAGGNPNEVVLVGSHLDSVPDGAGINDNGTGSAFNLELAVQLAKLAAPTNRVRFAWWGAEEEGLVGSTHYVTELSDAEFDKIELNLNFDMLGSPNHAKFVYDGDFSHTTPPATAPTVNPGSAEIEAAFVNYFTSQGQYTEPSAFDGRSDYKAFQDAGKPAGGLFSGAEVAKTADQAAPTKWGGLPDVAFDVNYHGEGDDINNINWVAFEQLSKGGAFVTGTFATRTLAANPGGGGDAVAKERSATRRAVTSEWLGTKLQR